MASVKLQGVIKRFGASQVLHGVDLDIADKEFVVLVGPSGCGKSTLLRIIAGLEDATEGELFIGGRRVTGLPPSKRGIAMVFQSYALYPHMTGFGNMAFGLKLAGANKDDIRKRVERAADVLQIRKLLDRKPKQMSGGQRQRVAIGRAIVREPEVFLFDEPLSNLDAKLRVQMRLELADLHDTLNATMVYVTHDQVEAMTLADRIVVLRDGHIEQVGAPMELYNRPVNTFVAGFVGSPSMNVLRGRVAAVDHRGVSVTIADDVTVPVPVDAAAVLVGSPVTLGVRPAHIVPGDTGDHVLSARAQSFERLGDVSYLYAKTSTDELIIAKGGDGARRGTAVPLSFAAHSCHVFDDNGRALPRLDAVPIADSIENVG